MNVRNWGQVFTPRTIVQQMIHLRRNKGSILEPSAGTGAFLPFLEEKAVGIEIDKKITTDNRVRICDFFEYSLKNKFQTVIGNPPYVRFQDISPATKNLLPK